MESEGHEALTWLQDRTRNPQRFPCHSKIASPWRGAAQAVAKPGQVWAGLGTMEADRCRDIGVGSEKEVVIGLRTGNSHCLNP